jgi:hypothetical protein
MGEVKSSSMVVAGWVVLCEGFVFIVIFESVELLKKLQARMFLRRNSLTDFWRKAEPRERARRQQGALSCSACSCLCCNIMVYDL